MSNAWILVRRNLRVFWRDRGQVFFSLLAPLILLMLYVLFLGKMQVDNMTSGMKGASSSDIEGFVYAWVLAGMVMITTLTTSLSALSSFVDDRASGRFKEFRVSPVRDTEIVVGYMVAGLIISLTLSMVVLVVGSVAFGAMFGTWSTAMGYAKAVAYVALLCLTFSSLAALAVTFVRAVFGARHDGWDSVRFPRVRLHPDRRGVRGCGEHLEHAAVRPGRHVAARSSRGRGDVPDARADERAWTR